MLLSAVELKIVNMLISALQKQQGLKKLNAHLLFPALLAIQVPLAVSLYD